MTAIVLDAAAGDPININSEAILPVLQSGLYEDMWANELARNAFLYGANICVFGIVWDAVKNYGNYPIGVWTDTVFKPQDMADFMPEVGMTDTAAAEGGSFHAGTRLSILGWSNFVVISRPDPTKPKEVYVEFLYRVGRQNRVYKWANGATSAAGMSKVILAEDLTQDEIDMLGFDPAEIPFDEGWVNRLEAEHIDKAKAPMTCFVLIGRDGMKDTWQGETGRARPITRSVINNRFWQPPIPVWAWEFTTPDVRANWLKAPPDGLAGGVPWKVDATHQWRQQHGLSQILRGSRREAPVYDHATLLDDGAAINVYVFPTTVKGGSPLDNAAYEVVRNGGFVVDYQGEQYYSENKAPSLRDWGIWNQKIAVRTVIRVVPPEWDHTTRTPGLTTADLGRLTVMWQEGMSRNTIAEKVAQWQHEFRERLSTDEMEPLRALMAGTSVRIDPVDVTKDMQELATEFGDLYTSKVTVEIPDPTATREVQKKVPRNPRRRRSIPPCPLCLRHLPLPGHEDGCPNKPVKSESPPPIPPGIHSWDGEKEPTVGRTVTVIEPDPDATITVTIDKPTVSFPWIEAVDWDVIGNGCWEACSWSPDERGPHREHGILRIAWGVEPNPVRYPTLIQAQRKLMDKFGVAADNGSAIEEINHALWRAIVRLIGGGFGHVLGQMDAGTFPRDSRAAKIREKQDHDVIVDGVTWALHGIQDLERFASPILGQTLSGLLARP